MVAGSANHLLIQIEVRQSPNTLVFQLAHIQMHISHFITSLPQMWCWYLCKFCFSFFLRTSSHLCSRLWGIFHVHKVMAQRCTTVGCIYKLPVKFLWLSFFLPLIVLTLGPLVLWRCECICLFWQKLYETGFRLSTSAASVEKSCIAVPSQISSVWMLSILIVVDFMNCHYIR